MLSESRSLITLIVGTHINEKLRIMKSHIVPPTEYSVTPTLTHYEKRSLYLICIFPTIIFRSEETEHIALAPPSVLPFSYKKYRLLILFLQSAEIHIPVRMRQKRTAGIGIHHNVAFVHALKHIMNNPRFPHPVAAATLIPLRVALKRLRQRAV